MTCRKSPLTPDQARFTLAHRLSARVDRLREIPTRLGLRSDRVFLVWTECTGFERGEGKEEEIARLEILPTPRVADLTSVTMNPFSGGILPAGSVRVDRISARFNDDILQGRISIQGKNIETVTDARGLRIKQPFDFFYEVVEDGRADGPLAAACAGVSEAEQMSGAPSKAPRAKYRLASTPSRDEGGVQFIVVLERESEDRTASGVSQLGQDAEDDV